MDTEDTPLTQGSDLTRFLPPTWPLPEARLVRNAFAEVSAYVVEEGQAPRMDEAVIVAAWQAAGLRQMDLHDFIKIWKLPRIEREQTWARFAAALAATKQGAMLK
jgi:hypothetical protein